MMIEIFALLAATAMNPGPPAVSVLREVQGGTSECPLLEWTTIETEALPEDVIVLIHGLDEPGDIWNSLAPALAREDFHALRFDYRDDGAISQASSDLIHALEDLKLRGVNKVTLIGHSMGGLVALDALTRPDGYANAFASGSSLPHVVRLMTIATPFGGSALAPMRAPLEIRDRAADLLRTPLMSWKTALKNDDGDGEAAIDLTPGSDFLRMLQSRGVPEGVAFTTIIARIGDDMKDSIGGLIDGERIRGALGDARIDAWMRELEAGSDALGDGVVSMESACAVACDDVTVLNATHRGVIRGLSFANVAKEMTLCDQEDAPPAIATVISRLKH
jgi:pimeloyl-ACP methyl ester carboxylesterase